MKNDYYQKYLKYKHKYLELKGAGFEQIANERRKRPIQLKDEFQSKLKQVKNNKLDDTIEENILNFNNIKKIVKTNYEEYVSLLSQNSLLLSNIYDILNVLFNSDINQNDKINKIYGYFYFLELYYYKEELDKKELGKNILDFKNIKKDIKKNYKNISNKLTSENLLISNVQNFIENILKNHFNIENKVIMIYDYISILEIYYNKINTF